MSFSVQTTNRFSVFGAEEAPQPKPQKKPEPKAKGKQQPKEKKPQQQQKKQAPARKPKSPDLVTDDGFTPVTDKRERRKPKSVGKQSTGQTRKRNFDRHVSGTGRGKEVKRRGQGKGNWGNVVEAGVEDAQERLNRPRRNKNRVRKPKPEEKKTEVEKKEGETEEPKEPTEEEKLRMEEEEKRRKEEEEEKKKLTLDQYLKKQQAQRPKVKKTRARRAGEGEAADKQFKALSKPSEDEVTVVQLKNKKESGAKSHSKKSKKEKRVAVTDFLKDAPKPARGKGKKGGDRRGRKAPAPQSQPNLKDESSFPSLG